MNPTTFIPIEIDLDQKCSVLIGSSRDLIELQRIVVTYNEYMSEKDRVQIDIYEDSDSKVVKGMLTGTAMGIFHIGIRLGASEEKKYLQGLGPGFLRDLILGK
jgi:hypothetical protein